jgi:hypothetical protein
MDIGYMILAPIVIYTLGYSVVNLFKRYIHDFAEVLVFSYLFGLSIVVIVLFIGGALGIFSQISTLLWLVGLITLIHLIFKLPRKNLKRTLNLSVEKLSLFALVVCIGLIITYILVLYSRAINDSDVANTYLPMARQIVIDNSITYSRGYDYNIFIKPIGGAILYGWIFSITNSIESEAFRMLPLTSLIASMTLVYLITKNVTKDRYIAIKSLVIYCILPIHDKLLLYNAFYPDTFYLPIIFLILYLLLKTSSQINVSSTFDYFSLGVAIGAASLFKAQSVYILPVIVVWLSFKFAKKIMSFYMASFSVFIPIFFYFLSISIQSGHFSPVFYLESLSGLIFLGSIWFAICFFVFLRNKHQQDTVYQETHILKKIIYLLLPFAVIISLQYGHQFLLYKTILWTSGISIPNIDWARMQLNASSPIINITPSPVGILFYVFLMLTIHMGFQYFLPFALGLWESLKTMGYRMLSFLLFSYITSLILSKCYLLQVTTYLTLNQRDMYILIPFFTIALGIFVHNISKKSVLNTSTILLYIYFASISYLTSVFIIERSLSKSIIYVAVALILNFAGLKEREGILYLPADMFSFLSFNFQKYLLISIICGLPPTLTYLYRKRLLRINIKIKFQFRIPKFISDFTRKYAKVFYVLLFLAIFAFPRIDTLFSQGGIEHFEEKELLSNIGSLTNLIRDYRSYNVKGIITFRVPSSLPYYLNNIRLLDLSDAANLAKLKEVIENEDITNSIETLQDLNITHLLLPINKQDMPPLLQTFFSRFIANTQTKVEAIYGDWVLFNIKG